MLLLYVGVAGADQSEGGAVHHQRALQPAGPRQGGPEGPDPGGRSLQAQLGPEGRQAEVDEETDGRGYRQ